MALRSIWKGFIRLSLVSVPVQAFTAQESDHGGIALNQLHAECNSRIRYQKVCPIHGEVSKDEIVSGYEYSKGQYVVVEPDELDKLRTASDKSISIESFVPPAAVDPLYYDGRTNYLLPDGRPGKKPYVLLYQAMHEEDRWGIATFAISGRDRLVLLRPVDGLLAMHFMSFGKQVRSPALLEADIPQEKVAAEELRLARRLISETSADSVDWTQYEDSYTERLRALIESKVEGREVVAPEAEEPAPVINLMDALRESVARSGRSGRSASKKKPSRQTQASKKKTAAKREPSPTKRKRKIS